MDKLKVTGLAVDFKDVSGIAIADGPEKSKILVVALKSGVSLDVEVSSVAANKAVRSFRDFLGIKEGEEKEKMIWV